MAEKTSTVRLENKSAHLKYISLPGGASIAVPPTEGAVGVTVKFDTEEERKQFDRAIESASVKAWIEAGELVVTTGNASEAKALEGHISPAQQVERSGADKIAAEKLAAAQAADKTADDPTPHTHHRTAVEPAEVTRREREPSSRK